MLLMLESMLLSKMSSARRGSQASRPWEACFMSIRIVRSLIPRVPLQTEVMVATVRPKDHVTLACD